MIVSPGPATRSSLSRVKWASPAVMMKHSRVRPLRDQHCMVVAEAAVGGASSRLSCRRRDRSCRAGDIRKVHDFVGSRVNDLYSSTHQEQRTKDPAVANIKRYALLFQVMGVSASALTRRNAGTTTGSGNSPAGRSTNSPTAPSDGPPRALLADRRGCREVVAVVEVGEQAGVGRLPAEDPPRRAGGGRVIQDDHRREEPEVRLQAVFRDAFGGDAQVVADALGDVPLRDALVPGRVPAGAGGAFSRARR